MILVPEATSRGSGEVGHGAVPTNALCCLGREARRLVDDWINKVFGSLPSAEKLRSFPVTQTQSILAVLLGDLTEKLVEHGSRLQLVWLVDGKTVAELPQKRSDVVLDTASDRKTLDCLYLAAVNDAGFRCCAEDLECGEECACGERLSALLTEFFPEAARGAYEWPADLDVTSLSKVQIEALAVWVNVQTLRLLGKALCSRTLMQWAGGAHDSLLPYVESVLVEGVEQEEQP